MDVTKLLEADHRQAEALFEQISTTEGEARRAIIEQLATALEAHMKLEESTLYPAMVPVTGEEEMQEGNTEHQLARKTLAEMVALGPDQPGFEAALAATKAGIEHHVGEEETTVFPKLREDGTVLEQLTPRFLQTRRDVGLPTDGMTIALSSNKDELFAEAQELGIDGASSMNKNELAEAVAASLS